MSDTLIGLVSHYSPSGAERPAVSFLVDRMKVLGYAQSFIDHAGNAVGILGSGPRQIVLLGHIDTVSGEIPVRVEDSGDRRVLFGRGSVDAKGPLACFTDAAARLGAVDGWQIVVIGAVEEERDSEGARFVAAQYRPDFAIVGEPNRWDRVALGYKGSAWAQVTLRREQAHTASGEPTACEDAVELWLALKAYADNFNAGRARGFDQLLLTLRGMDSGQDGFQQRARLKIGARLPVDLPPEGWYAALQETVAGAGIPVESVEPEGFAIPAYACEKNTPLARAFLKAIRAYDGTPSFVYKMGTADLNIAAPVWNCPALVYGPGDSALDHTPNEHISLDEYAKSVDVLTHALQTLIAS